MVAGCSGITVSQDDDNQADFLVEYNLKVESKISSNNAQTGIGFVTGGYRSSGAIDISSAPDIGQYDDNKLVWRCISSQVIDKHETRTS
jgi:hypothetical protein